MPRKISILQILALQLAHARRIVDEQQGLVAALRAQGQSAFEADGTLRTYLSALAHLEAHERELKAEAAAKKGESLIRRDPRRRRTGPEN